MSEYDLVTVKEARKRAGRDRPPATPIRSWIEHRLVHSLRRASRGGPRLVDWKGVEKLWRNSDLVVAE